VDRAVIAVEKALESEFVIKLSAVGFLQIEMSG